MLVLDHIWMYITLCETCRWIFLLPSSISWLLWLNRKDTGMCYFFVLLMGSYFNLVSIKSMVFYLLCHLFMLNAIFIFPIFLSLQRLNSLEWRTGLSLKSQELTAMFFAVRLYCSFVMEFDIHTLLDLATLATTLWVIFMIRFKLRSSYMEEKDNFAIYYVVSSCHSYLFIH